MVDDGETFPEFLVAAHTEHSIAYGLGSAHSGHVFDSCTAIGCVAWSPTVRARYARWMLQHGATIPTDRPGQVLNLKVDSARHTSEDLERGAARFRDHMKDPHVTLPRPTAEVSPTPEIVTTWATVSIGDVVRGADDSEWLVTAVTTGTTRTILGTLPDHTSRRVTMRKAAWASSATRREIAEVPHVTGQIKSAAPVTILRRSETGRAIDALGAAFGDMIIETSTNTETTPA